MLSRLFQSGSGKASTEKTQSRRVSTVSCTLQDHLSNIFISLQVDNHYQPFSNDQVYNPFTEVLVLSGGCVTSVHQIDLVEENKYVQVPMHEGLGPGVDWSS